MNALNFNQKSIFKLLKLAIYLRIESAKFYNKFRMDYVTEASIGNSFNLKDLNVSEKEKFSE